jgi:hypothetical protein
MNERKAVTRETRGEYHKAGKKEKGLILDQYVRLTGYNRKYAVRVLSKPAADKTVMTVMTVIDRKTVVYQAEKKDEAEKTLGKTYLHTGNGCLHRSHAAILPA